MLASRSPNTAALATSFSPSISGDGRWVAYSSIDEKVFGSDPRTDSNGTIADVFMYDRDNASVKYVSLNDAGEQATTPSFGASVSGDGHFVLFASAAPNLYWRASSGFQLYVRNLLSNQPPVVDAGADLTLLEGESLHRTASFTDADGSTSWTATVDFGSVLVDPDSKSLQVSSDPLSPGFYLVTIAVTDDAGATGTDTFRLTVMNVDPEILLGTEATYTRLEPRRASCAIPARQAPDETYTATVDYGDARTRIHR